MYWFIKIITRPIISSKKACIHVLQKLLSDKIISLRWTEDISFYRENFINCFILKISDQIDFQIPNSIHRWSLWPVIVNSFLSKLNMYYFPSSTYIRCFQVVRRIWQYIIKTVYLSRFVLSVELYSIVSLAFHRDFAYTLLKFGYLEVKSIPTVTVFWYNFIIKNLQPYLSAHFGFTYLQEKCRQNIYLKLLV